MFSDAEKINANDIRQNRFIEDVAQNLRMRKHFAIRVNRNIAESIDT
jgi:hypothetical protein